MEEQMFESQKDYYVPVLRIVGDMPDGLARRQEVLAEFKRRYGHRIPPEHLEPSSVGPNIEKWEDYASRGRQDLIDSGYLAMPDKGIWQITESGRRWLEEHPNDTHIKVTRRAAGQRGTAPRKTSARKERKTGLVPPTGLSLEMLEKTREAMGDEHFRPVWGQLYDQILAAERAKSITQINDSDLTKTARRQVRQIQNYIQGQDGNQPSSEQICDWIHFCYQFSLFREAAALYSMMNANDVNPWYLERTRKIAVTSRSKF